MSCTALTSLTGLATTQVIVLSWEVTCQFKFTTIQIPAIQILMKFSWGHILKYNKKIKNVLEGHKDYDYKKIY